ncbi:WcaF family extracellular polysaccharide biosynthesis acetyltransferase [Arsenicibacter rosenii]|uniref:WcaF family extracellular polysaccharide biosynthesis acetyltransferase n=1 Tax=Arsenicibacter rosenii TaxID=1750698 RepID=UPI0009F3DF97|nr:WcaF family extracellular polysaccharide biosynthesis acetyltransferase [Arsenicibacter rosenii]
MFNKSVVRLGEFDSSLGFTLGASKFKFVVWYIVKCIFFLNPFPFPNSIKRLLLILFGAKIGHSVIIKPRVNIHFPWKLEIGDYVWIGEEVFILNFEKVTVGNNVCISQRSFLCCGNHDYSIYNMPYRNSPITLYDGVWIGASSFIGPGVVIGNDTIVTAGSIINETLDSNGIYKTYTKPYLVKKRWK